MEWEPGIKKVNYLEGAYARGSFGKLSCPPEFKEYRKNYPSLQLGTIIKDKPRSPVKNKRKVKSPVKNKPSWRNSVLNYCKIEAQKNTIFSNESLIKNHLENIIKETQSKGKTPQQTLSRVLQNLRDENLIKFERPGRYILI